MTDETVVNNFEKYWQPKKKNYYFLKGYSLILTNVFSTSYPK